MPSRNSARALLRSATAPHHDRVDALFSGFALADPVSYGRFLQAQAAAHIPAEQALTAGGAADVLPDWPGRRRADALLADLAELGIAPPPAGTLPRFEVPAAVLGGVYVLEGSRLGGRLLRRQLPPGVPTRFLSGENSAAWRHLLDTLDARLVTEEERAAAVQAATTVFTLFETAAARSKAVSTQPY